MNSVEQGSPCPRHRPAAYCRAARMTSDPPGTRRPRGSSWACWPLALAGRGRLRGSGKDSAAGGAKLPRAPGPRGARARGLQRVGQQGRGARHQRRRQARHPPRLRQEQGHEMCRIVDLNHDGKPDLYEYYDTSGTVRRREYCYDDTGIVNAIEYYEGGKLVEARVRHHGPAQDRHVGLLRPRRPRTPRRGARAPVAARARHDGRRQGRPVVDVERRQGDHRRRQQRRRQARSRHRHRARTRTDSVRTSADSGGAAGSPLRAARRRRPPRSLVVVARSPQPAGDAVQPASRYRWRRSREAMRLASRVARHRSSARPPPAAADTPQPTTATAAPGGLDRPERTGPPTTGRSASGSSTGATTRSSR